MRAVPGRAVPGAFLPAVRHAAYASLKLGRAALAGAGGFFLLDAWTPIWRAPGSVEGQSSEQIGVILGAVFGLMIALSVGRLCQREKSQ